MDCNNHINLLRITYLFQFLLLIIIALINMFYKNSIIWVSYSINIIFIILVILLFIITLSPLVFFIIIFFKKTYKIFFTLYKIESGITILSIIISLALTIIFYLTDKDYYFFYRDCPYNYNLEKIGRIFNDSNTNNNLDINEKCFNKRCIEQNIDNDIGYICNYNSKIDFLNEELINCEIFNSNYIFESKIMNIYFNKCNSIVDFYLCKRYETPIKFTIDTNYVCPLEDTKSITLEIIIDIINFIIPIIIYITQFIFYKKILKSIVSMNIHRHRGENENGTVDTSKKAEINKNSKSFVKEPTDIIIVENESKKGDDIIQIINKEKNKNRNKKNILKFKSELLILTNTTVNHDIKKKKKDKENTIANSLNNNNDFNYNGKNRSFSNSNFKLFNNDKIDLLNIGKIATQVNNSEIIENPSSQRKITDNNIKNENSDIKCIRIKKNE